MPPELNSRLDHNEYFEYLRRRSPLGALYRRYWLYPRLARRLPGRCLDIGCGIGDMLVFRGGETVGVDVNPNTVAFCCSRGAMALLMAPDSLPFEAASFDSALMDNVLEHIERPLPLLAEVRRVLRPGGRLLVGVPGHRGYASDADHKVFYGESELRACLARAGFTTCETFHMPLGHSSWLDAKLRQYCLYVLFVRT
jgi:SAM-dependent methyltransferase